MSLVYCLVCGRPHGASWPKPDPERCDAEWRAGGHQAPCPRCLGPIMYSRIVAMLAKPDALSERQETPR